MKQLGRSWKQLEKRRINESSIIAIHFLNSGNCNESHLMCNNRTAILVFETVLDSTREFLRGKRAILYLDCGGSYMIIYT